MEIDPTNANEVAWTSWMPALGFALAASTRAVVEVGIGHFSTPFLHEYCAAQGRWLYSIENHAGWRASFAAKYETGRHLFVEPSEESTFGVAFIDSSPGGEERAYWFKRFKDSAQFLVVHDYHRENEAAIAPLLVGMNYRVFDKYQPPTLLASKWWNV
jgi:hypothetical protein